MLGENICCHNALTKKHFTRAEVEEKEHTAGTEAQKYTSYKLFLFFMSFGIVLPMASLGLVIFCL